MLGLSLRGWLEWVEDYAVYLVVKSNASRPEDLQQLLHALRETLDLHGFYIHMNGNNLALLPDPVNKRAAAAEILRRHTAVHGRVPVFGLGIACRIWAFCACAILRPSRRTASWVGNCHERAAGFPRLVSA
ncbi:MAG: hypothetical protein HZT40_12520 [Candidatus Thiothrix singaporensis]|uniref:Uncharacterized protein n=1 Tax=Candidatus Thiothrix singaporensis TaxID=2799669 RepID=A0A7L6AT21_9GAMM|nr:MAG: hypothetical protein HZT40_12520 [Candidatus Thiothrix singaporensis]